MTHHPFPRLWLAMCLVGSMSTAGSLPAVAGTFGSALSSARASIDPPLTRVASRRSRAAAEAGEAPGAFAGRYAVLRGKHDTGCMLTLDTARIRGGARAQLAPGCRDQGIVIFDPTEWQVVKGELVLTARAGHKARLQQAGEGVWAKDPKEGKPLGLKRL